MQSLNEKIKEEAKETLDKNPKVFRKRVSIIFDGKQYNIRIPIEFVKKSQLDLNKDEFEFVIETSEDKTSLPVLHGELVEKEK